MNIANAAEKFGWGIRKLTVTLATAVFMDRKKQEDYTLKNVGKCRNGGHQQSLETVAGEGRKEIKG